MISGKIDVAIMWGPLGGYYAKQSDVDLVVVEIPEYSKGIKNFKEKHIGIFLQVLGKEKLKEERWLKVQYLEI